MLKTNTTLEIAKDIGNYILHIPQNCTLGQLHDVLFEMREFVVGKINEAISAQKKMEQKPEVKEPIVEGKSVEIKEPVKEG